MSDASRPRSPQLFGAPPVGQAAVSKPGSLPFGIWIATPDARVLREGVISPSSAEFPVPPIPPYLFIIRYMLTRYSSLKMASSFLPFVCHFRSHYRPARRVVGLMPITVCFPDHSPLVAGKT